MNSKKKSIHIPKPKLNNVELQNVDTSIVDLIEYYDIESKNLYNLIRFKKNNSSSSKKSKSSFSNNSSSSKKSKSSFSNKSTSK